MIPTLFERWDDGLRQGARQHFWLGAGALLLFTLLYCGLGFMPVDWYLDLSANPYAQRTDINLENYFQESSLLSVVAHVSGLLSRPTFIALCLAILLAGFLRLTFAARRQGAFWGWLLLALLLGHPVTLVLLSWLGSPDCITFLLTAVLLYSRRGVVVLLATWLGVFNHPIMMFVAPALLALKVLAREEGLGWRHVALAALGVAAGWLTVKYFLYLNDIDLVSRREFIESRDWSFWSKHNLTYFLAALFSLHNVGWLVLLACLAVGFRYNRGYFGALAGVHLLFYGVTFFCLDTTRVFALLAWAPLWHGVAYALRVSEAADLRLRCQLERVLAVLAVAGLFSPSYYFWAGKLYCAGHNRMDLWGWLRTLL